MAEGKVFGDPDDAERSKAKALIEFGKWFKRACTAPFGEGLPGSETGAVTIHKDLEIYWWIDWACTDQDDPGPDMAALPAYAAVCHGIVAAWNDVYKDRVRAARPAASLHRPPLAPPAPPQGTPLAPAAPRPPPRCPPPRRRRGARLSC